MRAVLATCVCFAILAAGCAPARVRLPLPAIAATPAAAPAPTAPPQRSALLATPAPRVDPAPAPARLPTMPPPQQPAFAPPIPMLAGLLDGLLPDEDSPYGLVLEDLVSGARTGINASNSYPSASLYKLGVAWTILRQVDAGALSLDTQLEIQDDDAVEAEPQGGVAVGETPTIRDLLDSMLTVSSNASAHALLRLMTRAAFTAEMDRIGLNETRVPDDGTAVTTPADIAHLLRLIATSGELSTASRELMTQDMASGAPPDALRDTLPDEVGIYDKTGNLEDASNVGALLETPRATVILVVLDSGVDPGDARAIIGQVGQIAYHSLLQ